MLNNADFDVQGDQEKPYHSTYIAIHSRNSSTDVLYVSSGVREALGFRPADVLSMSASSFITDDFKADYSHIYNKEVDSQDEDKLDADDDDDEANVHCFYVNITSATGTPTLVRVTSITCSNCVIAAVMAFPEITNQNQKELEVEMLDGAMKRVNITRERVAQIERQKSRSAPVGQERMLFRARNKQVKAAVILERADVASLETEETGGRSTGPLIVFCTGSISHLIEADTSDVMNYPFLKLVAPESVVHVSNFLDKVLDSSEVMFETFALLKQPHIIDGDIFVSDEENRRVIVECLGAGSSDGVALLLRCLRIEPAPKRNTMGDYVQSSSHDINKDSGYLTLADIISSDAETTDAAAAWSKLR
ncbi:hypothetical protein IWW50_000835 [Coemansia erecta]|nr:hypothetical protein IWW50_000835 [Coemansia erecta]